MVNLNLLKVTSSDASTSCNASKYSHKSCFSFRKTGHISRLCTEKKPQVKKYQLTKESAYPNHKSKQTVPTQKGTACKHCACCIQGNDGYHCQRSIAPHKTDGINQQNAIPQQVDGYARSVRSKGTDKSSKKILNKYDRYDRFSVA